MHRYEIAHLCLTTLGRAACPLDIFACRHAAQYSLLRCRRMAAKGHFEGEITVSSRIVDYLSSGLYESPAACLKELINNSYDADAALVEVFVKPDADRIIIADDGHGLNRAEFKKHFTRISESHKRDNSDKTPRGREKIGKIGIGFIAANEICNEMEIVSTKAGSRELLRVTIHFDKMREDLEVRRRENDDIAKADYTGEVDEAPAAAHYTRIFLKRVRGEAREILAGAIPARPGAKHRSLYGLPPERIRDLLADTTISSWSEFDEYSRTMLRVALNVPVRYHDAWLPKRDISRVQDIAKEVDAKRFRVEYDGTELRKPIVLRPRDSSATSSFVRRFEFSGKHVSAHGYFYAQHGTIKPEDLQGLLIRIRQAAVGGYDSGFMDFPASEGSLIQRWISAEIWADDRLEDAMNIDRRTLRVAHPSYVELQRELHKELRAVIADARKRLYEAGNTERKKNQGAAAVSELRQIVAREVAPSNPRVAAAIDDALQSTGRSAAASGLARRMSVVELYGLVVQVARETLPPRLFGQFMRVLTERLNR